MVTPTNDPGADGRRARGDASRRLIVEASGRVIAASGLCAVTHRAVAAEAGVSLARTTYHFPTVGELLEATQVHITATLDDRLHELVRLAGEGKMTVVDACCAYLGEIIGPQRTVFLARVELGIAAARHPDLASMMSAATRGVIASMAEFGASVEWATATLAAMYGFAALAVTEQHPASPAEIRKFVEHTVRPTHPRTRH